MVLAALFSVASASEHLEDTVGINEAQMPFFPQAMGMGMDPMMMQMMSMMGQGMMGQGMFPQQSQSMSAYPIDYSLNCASSCNCNMMCVPWISCPCQCPPICPTETRKEFCFDIEFSFL